MRLSIISPRIKSFSLEDKKEHYEKLFTYLRFIYSSHEVIIRYFDEGNETRFYKHIYCVHYTFRQSFEPTDKRLIRMSFSLMVLSLIFSNDIVRLENTNNMDDKHLNMLWKFISGIVRIGFLHDEGYGTFDFSMDNYMREQFPEHNKDLFNSLLFNPLLSQKMNILYLFKEEIRPSPSPRPASIIQDMETVARESPIFFDYSISEGDLSAYKSLFDIEAIKNRIKRLREIVVEESAIQCTLQEEYKENKKKLQRLIEI